MKVTNFKKDEHRIPKILKDIKNSKDRKIKMSEKTGPPSGKESQTWKQKRVKLTKIKTEQTTKNLKQNEEKQENQGFQKKQ